MSMMPLEILQRLEEHGYEANFVGGCVRDEDLGEPVNDYDIVTNATPEEIEKIFADQSLNFVGKTFGVMRVNDIEVATYRTEVYNVAGKPDVNMAGTFYEDASRRDFTINAMAKSLRGEVIDYFNGKDDLQNKLIRAVGSPVDRFKEDPSRIIRGMYLAARLGFSIEEQTFEAMRNLGGLLKTVPAELVGKYIEKVIHNNVLSCFIRHLKETNTLQYVFPEIAHTIGIPQNPKYHHLDVFDHIIAVLEAVEKRFPKDLVMALAAVYHDCMKGTEGIRGENTSGQPNDLGHEEAGAPVAEEAVIRYNFGKETASKVAFLVRFHGLRLEENPKHSTTKRLIRKLVSTFSDKESLRNGFDQLIAFMECDSEGFSPDFRDESIRATHSVKEVSHIVLNDTIFYRSELPINGKDLIALGIEGKRIGEVLDALVLDNFQSRKAIMKTLKRRGWIEEKSVPDLR